MVEGKSSNQIRAQRKLHAGEYERSMAEVSIAHVARIGAGFARFVALAAVRPMGAGKRLISANGVGNFAEASMMRTTKSFGAQGKPQYAQNEKRNGNSKDLHGY